MPGGSGSSKGGDRVQHFTVGKEKFRVGDTITLRPPTVNENPFIGRIHEVRKTNKSLKLYVSWFYRPEEARGGRKGFHGERSCFSRTTSTGSRPAR
jgi:hypothetical protein